MKKKLLFLGFLVGIFAALMILPASAECGFCTESNMSVTSAFDYEHHCEEVCACSFVECPACGDDSLLLYCRSFHIYELSEMKSGTTYGSALATCTVCGDTWDGFVGSYEHNFSRTGTVKPTCIFRGFSYVNCKYCSLVQSRTDFTNATGHNLKTVTSELSCTSDGYTTYSCADCGISYQSDLIEAPGHQPIGAGTVTPATCTTSGYTTHTCSTCNETYTVDEVPATGHTYTSEITTPATCSSTGVKTYTCSNCSDSYTETIAKTDHSYQSTVTAPTCTTAGYTTYTCTVCAYSYTGNNTAATGHKNTTKVTTAATCTTAGSQTTTCSVCGYSTTASIAATGHSYKNTTVVPDCTEGGYTKYVCSTCGDSYTGDQIAATGHQYQHIVTEPTCTKGGYTTHVCSVCQDTYTDALTLPTGHSYQSTVTDPTCTVRGYTDHICADCGDSYRDTYVAALGHVEERYGMDWKCTVCGNIRIVTTGIRAVGNIVDGFRIFGVGFASGTVELFDGMVMNGEELTTIASAAFALIGLALAVVIAFIVFRKFTKRQ